MSHLTRLQPTVPVSTPGLMNTLDLESLTRRLICLALAGVLAIAFVLVMLRFWTPAHGGVDQNGYLVGGKMLAEHGSMALVPRRPDTGRIDSFQFIGRMWVGFDLGTPQERYLPKYPLGLPLLYAGALHLGGERHGLTLLYLVSPLAMAASLIAVYLSARLLIGSLSALAITLLVASSPATLLLTNNPNSHAVTLLLVSWGMFLLIRWWLKGGWISAALSGLLLGSAVSIRYSEGTLLLPLSLVAMMRLKDAGWADRLRIGQAACLLVGWALPVIALLAHNQWAMGAWTGYGPTNESTGFRWEYFVENWDTMLRQLYQTGMTLVFPMAIGGLAAGFVWNWRIAAILCAWIVPCLLLYTAYYWAPDALNIGYTRFFLTIFPAMGICAFGLLLWPVTHLPAADGLIRKRLKLGGGVALGVVTLLSVALGINNAGGSLQSDRVARRNLQDRANQVMAVVPPGSVLISYDMNLLHHLQMASQYTLYSPEVFNRGQLNRLGNRDPNEPQGLDPTRSRYMLELTEGMTQNDLDHFRDQLLSSLIRTGHRVFVFSAIQPNRPQAARFSSPSFNTTTVMEGTDLLSVPRTTRGFAGMFRRPPAPAAPARWHIEELTLN